MGDVAFLDRMAPYARKATQETGIPTSVILAQWAWETTWGKAKGATVRNNYGGISNFTGSVPSWSKAYKVDPRPADEKGWYYNYKTIDDFVADYITVMKHPNYAAVRAAGSTPGLLDDATALGNSPYAKSSYMKNGVPGGNLVDLIRANELWSYDQGGTAATLATVKGTVKLNTPDVVSGKDASGGAYLLLMGAAAVAVLAMLSE